MTPAELRRAADELGSMAALVRDNAPDGVHGPAYHARADRIDDLARKLRAEADGRGWQPIETAPRDGTRLLLYSVHRRRIADGEFGNYRVWSWPYVMVEPSHWQPLPPGPTQEHD